MQNGFLRLPNAIEIKRRERAAMERGFFWSDVKSWLAVAATLAWFGFWLWQVANKWHMLSPEYWQ